MGRFCEGRICRSAVEDGSKGCFDGVTKALRFCTIESSIMPRDIRKKSRSALSLKQNWGANLGNSEGCDILRRDPPSSFAFSSCCWSWSSGCACCWFAFLAFVQKKPASMKCGAILCILAIFERQPFLHGWVPRSRLTNARWEVNADEAGRSSTVHRYYYFYLAYLRG